MWRPVVVGLALWLLLPCTSALAASVRISDDGWLAYRADPGERNDLRIAVFEEGASRGHHFAHFDVEDSVAVRAGAGCVPAASRRRHFLRCSVDLPSTLEVRVLLGDRNDRGRIIGHSGQAAFASGGPGDDRLTGGDEADFLQGGPGADTLSGGAGDDGLEADSLDDYTTDYPPTLSLAGTSRRAGDRLFGGAGNDRLIGSAGANLLAGGPGSDYMHAGPGRDRILDRGLAVDYATCGPGRDTARNDSFDFLSSCERRLPLSPEEAVPVAVHGPGTFNDNGLVLLVGCRPFATGGCAGTAYPELHGRRIGPDVSFEATRDGFATVSMTTSEFFSPEDFMSDAFTVVVSSGGFASRTPARRLQSHWFWL